MSSNDVLVLVQRLKDLTIARQRINEEEQRIISLLEEALPATTSVPPPVVIADDPVVFSIDDRVRILNETRKSGLGLFLNRGYNSDKDRIATVTSVSGDRVWFITDNGEKTWRKAKNLHKIES